MDNQRKQPPFSNQQPPQRPRSKTGRLQPPGNPQQQRPPHQQQRPPQQPHQQQRPPGQRPPAPGQKQQRAPQQQPQGPRSSLESSDSVQVSGQAGPARKDPPPVVARSMDNMFLPPEVAAVKDLEDGAKIVRYKQPQKLGKLLKDAKSNMGGDSSRFYGKGWVIGEGIAKIASDGTSIIYYPDDVSDLVRDLLGPDSETI